MTSIVTGPSSTGDPVAVAVGDIACPATGGPSCKQLATATLAANQRPNEVFVLGDNQYDSGLFSEYQSAGAYNDTWGVFGCALCINATPIVHPVPGNHEYAASSTAAGYFQYFGQTIANPDSNTEGYYSFNVGSWHIIALNSECDLPTSCADSDAGTYSLAELTWLQNDLASDTSACTLAMWHHPLFSSGWTQGSPGVAPLWSALYNAHADIVLNGHDHLYERYAQQDASGNATANGIREFVVGTGGESLNGLGTWGLGPNLQAYDTSDFGVLRLTLHPTSYDWEFINTSGTVKDQGTAGCHGHATGLASVAAAPSVARDIAEADVPALIRRSPRLVFDARPLTSSLAAVIRGGLPLAVYCSRKCDVLVHVSLRQGRRLRRIATFFETDIQIPVAHSTILVSLPAARLQGLRKATLVLQFTTRDAANHHGALTRIVQLR
jgi:hypothetical protein